MEVGRNEKGGFERAVREVQRSQRGAGSRSRDARLRASASAVHGGRCEEGIMRVVLRLRVETRSVYFARLLTFPMSE